MIVIVTGILISCNSKSGNTDAKKDAESAKVLAEGRALFQREDCGGCHAENTAIVGPSFRQLAAEYEATDANISHLAYMAIIGVKAEHGIWGSREMTPHPKLSQEDAEKIVRYMLSFPPDPEKPFLHNTK